MLKIWAKALIKDKIVKDMLYKRFEKYDPEKFMEYLIEICHEFDYPTPVVLKSHTKNFASFNVTRFKASDFVEPIDFDVLVLENASD